MEAIENEWLPNALSMGIPENVFWNLDPMKIEPYIRAREIKDKRKVEEANFQGWITGIYITHALSCVLSQTHRYPEKPIELFGDDLSEDERMNQEATIFAAYAEEYNRRLRKENT